MSLDIRITFDAPRGAASRLARFFGPPVALVLAASAAAWAYDTAWIADGQPVSASKLKANLDEVQARLAAIESGNVPCLPGYTQDASVTAYTVCKKGADEMVKVGAGREAFWIDRYEASVWSAADGTGTQYGATSSGGVLITDYPASFPKNGQRDGSFVPLYAVSKKNAQPSANLTWFQAQQACRASGKRLPSDEEWLAAANGTNDPGSNNGGGGACVTSASGPRATGNGANCASAWGAEDLIGNVWEWTADWYAGLGAANTSATWPTGYNGDGTWNIASSAYPDPGSGGPVAGLPAAALRGSGWTVGTLAGVFMLGLDRAPSQWALDFGLRCAAR